MPFKFLTFLISIYSVAALANAEDAKTFAENLRGLSKNRFRHHLVIPASVAKEWRLREERRERADMNDLWQYTKNDMILHITDSDRALIASAVAQWLPASVEDSPEDAARRAEMSLALARQAQGMSRSRNAPALLRLRRALGDLYDKRMNKLDQAMVAGDETLATDLRADVLRIAGESFVWASFYQPPRRDVLAHVQALHARVMFGAVSIVGLAATAWTLGWHNHPVVAVASLVFPLVATVLKRFDLAEINKGKASIFGLEKIKEQLRRKWLVDEKIELNSPSQHRSFDFSPSEMISACDRYLERAPTRHECCSI